MSKIGFSLLWVNVRSGGNWQHFAESLRGSQERYDRFEFSEAPQKDR
jgi:hypothetical protein